MNAAVGEALLGWSRGISVDICANGEMGPSAETSWTDEVGEGEKPTKELILLAFAVHAVCVYGRYKRCASIFDHYVHIPIATNTSCRKDNFILYAINII